MISDGPMVQALHFTLNLVSNSFWRQADWQTNGTTDRLTDKVSYKDDYLLSKNFSITVETFKLNPYLRTETTMQTPTYKEYLHLIDVKMMSIQKNNAKKFFEPNKVQVQYEQQVGFR